MCLTNFGKFLAIISSNISFVHSFSFSLFWILNTHILNIVYLIMSHISQILKSVCFLFVFFFSLFHYVLTPPPDVMLRPAYISALLPEVEFPPFFSYSLTPASVSFHQALRLLFCYPSCPRSSSLEKKGR